MNSTFLNIFSYARQYKTQKIEAAHNQQMPLTGRYSFTTVEVPPLPSKEEEFVETSSSEVVFTYGIPYSQTEYHIATLLQDYLSGEKDVPQLADELNQSASNVVLLLERTGAQRDFSQQRVSKKEEEDVLSKLAAIRGAGKIAEYNSEESIKREVVASQRIESVIVLD